MWAYLDLNWKPKPTESTPPVGKAPGLIRNDTYAHTIRVTDGVLNGFDDWTWTAQIRLARLTASATVAAPLASFTVTLEADGDDLLVHLGLASATTTTLNVPKEAFWDLQLSDGTTVTTWLTGKVKVFDDVSRAA